MIDILKIIEIIAMILALVLAVAGHEFMHGYIAYKYGDDTAKREGRLSFNPIVHIDPVGTILVPAVLFFTNAPFLFGWAKPVPVDIRKVILNGGYGGAIAVALAGITYNLVLAGFAAALLPLFLKPTGLFEGFMLIFLLSTVKTNIVLAVFNLWPIPPLDGSKALYFLALRLKMYRFAELYDKISPYGMLILIAVLLIPELSNFLFIPASWIINILF
jgi:Zn-dependent protease